MAGWAGEGTVRTRDVAMNEGAEHEVREGRGVTVYQAAVRVSWVCASCKWARTAANGALLDMSPKGRKGQRARQPRG